MDGKSQFQKPNDIGNFLIFQRHIFLIYVVKYHFCSRILSKTQHSKLSVCRRDIIVWHGTYETMCRLISGVIARPCGAPLLGARSPVSFELWTTDSTARCPRPLVPDHITTSAASDVDDSTQGHVVGRGTSLIYYYYYYYYKHMLW